MSDLVYRRDEGGVAILSLSRPEVLNALSPALFEELRAHVDRLADETETIGCVVLRGEGRSFSAGNDLRAIQAGERAPSPHFQAETLEAIEALPQPVIASVQGHCYTGALELVLACDLIVCTESVRLCDTHGKWGMSPTWGMTQRLPRRVGSAKAKEIMFTGREIGGEEAVAIGLANLCVPDDELEPRTLEFARSMIQNSWWTLRSEKQLVNTGQRYPLAEALRYEREQSRPAPDMRERLAEFGRKRES